MAIATLSDKVKFIQDVFGAGRLARNAKNMDVRCPICNPKDANKRKLAIRVDDDWSQCWTCGFKARSLVPLLRQFGTREQLRDYIDRFLPETEKHRCRNVHIFEGPPKLTLPVDFKLLVLANMLNPNVKAVRRYAFDRGLSERDLWYYRIGVSDEQRWSRRLIVPSFDAHGELNYFVGRSVDRFVKPKYDNPDVDKVPIIFNEMNVDWTKRLVLCEGTFDMFNCGENVVPILGSDLNEQSAIFNAILVHSTPVALALDADMWDTKTPRAAKKLAGYDIDVSIVDTRSFSDPGNATKDQFAEALAKASKFDWNDEFNRKLRRAVRTSMAL